MIEWDAQATGAAATTTQFYVPKGRRTPVGWIVAAVILGVGAVVGVALLVYNKVSHPAVVVIQPDGAPAVAPPPVIKPKGLFDPEADQALARQIHSQGSSPGGSPAGAAPSGPAASADAGASAPPDAPALAPAPAVASSDTSGDAAAPPPPPAASAGDDEAPPDPDDPEWKDIASAHFNVRHQGIAILKFDEFRREHPGKYTHVLDRYTDEAVNWLYWQRLVQLWNRRDDLTAQVNEKKHDLRSQPAGAFHDQLAKDKADLDAKLATTQQLLTGEMGFAGDEPPDLEKPTQLKKMESQRDPARYAAFAKHVLKYVRDYHGSVWWEGE